jgi:hypothetical protein
VPIDPTTPAPATPAGRTAAKLADLERRLAALERGVPTIQTGTGAPTSSPRDGTPYADVAAPRLYLRVNGAWKSTVLA